jgi:5-formyltetrahydrofolate cyclo-ligase
MPDPSPDKALLRRELRRRRQALSSEQQHAAAAAVARRIEELPDWQSARRVAVYLAADGEIDTAPLAALARAREKVLYLPVILPDDSLTFARWQQDATLRANRYGIPEPPETAESSPAGELDLIVLPLVGWDRRGGRLGMGGGFYDRTLEEVSGTTLLGLGHSCQELESVPVQAWDIRLDFVATDAALLDCRGA